MSTEFKNLADSLQDLEIPITVADPQSDDCPIVYCNTAFEGLTGHKFSTIVGQNCRFLQGEATERADVQRLKAAILRGEDAAVCLFNYQADGTPFHNFLIVRPFITASGRNLLLGCQYHFAKFNGFEAFETHNRRVQGVLEDRLSTSDHAQEALENCMQLRANTIRTKIEIYLKREADRGALDLVG